MSVLGGFDMADVVIAAAAVLLAAVVFWRLPVHYRRFEEIHSEPRPVHWPHSAEILELAEARQRRQRAEAFARRIG